MKTKEQAIEAVVKAFFLLESKVDEYHKVPNAKNPGPYLFDFHATMAELKDIDPEAAALGWEWNNEWVDAKQY